MWLAGGSVVGGRSSADIGTKFSVIIAMTTYQSRHSTYTRKHILARCPGNGNKSTTAVSAGLKGWRGVPLVVTVRHLVCAAVIVVTRNVSHKSQKLLCRESTRVVFFSNASVKTGL